MGGHDARVDDGDAAPARQLCGYAPDRVSRAVRVFGARRAEGFCDADSAGRQRSVGRFERDRWKWRRRSQALIELSTRQLPKAIAAGAVTASARTAAMAVDVAKAATFAFRRRVIASACGRSEEHTSESSHQLI